KRNLIITVRTEVNALKMLHHHRHLVRLLEVLESKQMLYIVLELVECGELFNKIKNILAEEVIRDKEPNIETIDSITPRTPNHLSLEDSYGQSILQQLSSDVFFLFIQLLYIANANKSKKF
ncbi:hypothetical protein RFI_29076, partial [Reticulomyxa filosa]